jgi:hypothetical protein
MVVGRVLLGRTEAIKQRSAGTRPIALFDLLSQGIYFLMCLQILLNVFPQALDLAFQLIAGVH